MLKLLTQSNNTTKPKINILANPKAHCSNILKNMDKSTMKEVKSCLSMKQNRREEKRLKKKKKKKKMKKKKKKRNKVIELQLFIFFIFYIYTNYNGIYIY